MLKGGEIKSCNCVTSFIWHSVKTEMLKWTFNLFVFKMKVIFKLFRFTKSRHPIYCVHYHFLEETNNFQIQQ